MTPKSSNALNPAGLARSANDFLLQARAAVENGRWQDARTALQLAETTFVSALEMVEGKDLEAEADFDEGRAQCWLLLADIELRHWNLDEAETQLDAAYKVLKQGEGLGVELWRLTARLAERRGRWTSAFAAWRRVAKKEDGTSEMGLADAWIRAAEVALIEGKSTKMDEYLVQAEELARELDNDLVRARVAVVRGAGLAVEGDTAAANDVFEDAERLAEGAPADFRGLLKLRQAANLVGGSPRRAARAVQEGFELLVEGNHPDAIGLALSQLTSLGVESRSQALAAMGAYGTEVARGGRDGTSRPILAAALRRKGEEDLAVRLDEPGVQLVEVEGLMLALEDERAEVGIPFELVADPDGIAAFTRTLSRVRGQTLQVRVEDAWVVSEKNALGRQLASLTWDPPQAVLVALAAPPKLPDLATAPAAPPRIVAATVPPVVVREPIAAPVETPRDLLASGVGVMMLSFLVAFAVVLFVILVALVVKILTTT